MEKKYTFIIRVSIVLFWFAAIFGFLFFPAISTLWESKKTINVMTWAGIIDVAMLEKFKEETGIVVNLSYVENNEELYVRFKATQGKDVDLIVPSDYVVQLLIRDDLLQPLDRNKLTMWSSLDPRLTNLFYDPGNTYSIPYYWALYGIGYNKKFFTSNPPSSWQLLFNPTLLKYPIAMSNVAREAILLAALHLFGTTKNLNETQLAAIQNLLVQQKKWVGAYSESHTDYLLFAQEFPIVLTQTPLIWRMLKEHPQIGFIVPQEGTFVLIDNFVIPKFSKKEDLVYTFLNFLYRPDVLRYHFEHHRFFPATNDLMPLLQEHHAPESIIAAHEAIKKASGQEKLTKEWHFFENTVPAKIVEDIWITIKS